MLTAATCSACYLAKLTQVRLQTLRSTSSPGILYGDGGGGGGGGREVKLEAVSSYSDVR